MATDLSNKTALVFDLGAFVFFAQALGGPNGFGRVLYFSPYQSFSPDSRDALIGRGIEPLERTDSFWANLDDADAIVFPDVGMGDLQQWLRHQGYRVWGSGMSELLELDRSRFLKTLAEAGAPVPETETLIGLDELEAHLKDPDNADRWLKRSFFRQDFETFHHESYWLSKPWLDDLETRLGPHAEEALVLSQVSCPGREIGYDGPYCIGGHFARESMWGYEGKDKWYVGKHCPVTQMPDAIQDALSILSPTLAALDIRGNWHLEIRVCDDGKAYITDPCHRCASPPTEAMTEFITNWPELVWEGSDGHAVEPKYAAKYCAQVVLSSAWLADHFLSIHIPPNLLNRVKLRRAAFLNGEHWAIPGHELDSPGSTLGMGGTPEAAMDEALEVAKEVQGYQLDYAKVAKDEMLETIEKGEPF